MPHRPKFSVFFDLCLYWVSAVRARLSKQQQQSEEKVGIDHESPKRRFLALSQSHQTYGTHFSLMVTSWDLPLTHSVTLPSTLRHENSIGSFFAQYRRVGTFGDMGTALWVRSTKIQSGMSEYTCHIGLSPPSFERCRRTCGTLAWREEKRRPVACSMYLPSSTSQL